MKRYQYEYASSGNIVYCVDTNGKHLQAICIDDKTAECVVIALNELRDNQVY